VSEKQVQVKENLTELYLESKKKERKKEKSEREVKCLVCRNRVNVLAQTTFLLYFLTSFSRFVAGVTFMPREGKKSPDFVLFFSFSFYFFFLIASEISLKLNFFFFIYEHFYG
jgi:hypothetical protein